MLYGFYCINIFLFSLFLTSLFHSLVEDMRGETIGDGVTLTRGTVCICSICGEAEEPQYKLIYTERERRERDE